MLSRTFRVAPDARQGGLVLNGALGALAFLTIALGLYPAPVVDVSMRAASELLSQKTYVDVVLDEVRNGESRP